MRTRNDYEDLLRLHLKPAFGATPLAGLSVMAVRRWWAHASGPDGHGRAPKTYRLLRAILNTAVEDGLIARNPCRVKGAGADNSPERPTVTVEQVYVIADAIAPRYRALVLLAAFTGLRFGELRALRRKRLDIETATDRGTGVVCCPCSRGSRFVSVLPARRPWQEGGLHRVPGRAVGGGGGGEAYRRGSPIGHRIPGSCPRVPYGWSGRSTTASADARPVKSLPFRVSSVRPWRAAVAAICKSMRRGRALRPCWRTRPASAP